MRLAAAVLALVAVLPISDGDARSNRKAGKKGKVVRVERGKGTKQQTPKWCQIRPDGSASCYGKAPNVGDTAPVFDDIGRKAVVTVSQVTPSVDSCGNTVSWEIITQVKSGDVSQSNYAWAAVFDYDSTSNTRTIYNNGQIPVPGNRPPGIESVWQAFDDDNDDQADLIITYFNCDAAGQVTQQYGGYCMAYYLKTGSGYTEARVDNIRSC